MVFLVMGLSYSHFMKKENQMQNFEKINEITNYNLSKGYILHIKNLSKGCILHIKNLSKGLHFINNQKY